MLAKKSLKRYVPKAAGPSAEEVNLHEEPTLQSARGSTEGHRAPDRDDRVADALPSLDGGIRLLDQVSATRKAGSVQGGSRLPPRWAKRNPAHV